MECNECSCWVHARCEGLSDDSYQILSYLPDSIEFTCRQCSPDPNSVWRNAIEAELKAGLIAVIKSLSKNRRACAALKWSPRKECLCRPLPTVRKLDFSAARGSGGEQSSEYMAGKSNNSGEETDEQNTKKSAESETAKSTSSVSSRLDNLRKYDFDPEETTTVNDAPRRGGLRRLRHKLHAKDCNGKAKTTCYAGKESSESESNQEGTDGKGGMCHCLEQEIIARPSPTLNSIKLKVNGNEYGSLQQFHIDMKQFVSETLELDLVSVYHDTLREVFPWFDPLQEQTSSSDDEALSPSKEYPRDLNCSMTRLDDSILERWKDEITKVPKAIAAKSVNLHGGNLHTNDTRCCGLCKGLGDKQENKEGRLMYCGQNEWIHANCALWSNEVFEEIDGSLQNVHSAVSRSRLTRCTECGKKGASIGCCFKNCSNTYHYPCARSLEMAFYDDKTVFCKVHMNSCTDKSRQTETEFSVKRPVYVELDRKKKKYAEPDKVRVMIGCLSIESLGTISPEFSDCEQRLIPCEYKCSRLYWSTVNPLKIVRYYIRTYVFVETETHVEQENNVTIDHTVESERAAIVKQTLEALVGAVCSREVDENLAEQNTTDIFPPEIKDAIFEDIPHDLLDGISMQDIFPKMSYEDFLAMDLKSDSVFPGDLLKDDMIPNDEDEKQSENRVSRIQESVISDLSNDLWPLQFDATKTATQEFVDEFCSGTKNLKLNGRELKRSKSEVMQSSNPTTIFGGQRNHHQRSCSLSWSCKLDGTYSTNLKRRKLPQRTTPGNKCNEIASLIDQGDRSSVFHELRIPESIVMAMSRAATPSIISEKYCIDETSDFNRKILPTRKDSTKTHKRLLWHVRSQPRILQVSCYFILYIYG